MNNNKGQDDNINMYNNTPIFEDRIDTKESNIHAERIRNKILKKVLKTPKRKRKYIELEEERIIRLQQDSELEQFLKLKQILKLEQSLELEQVLKLEQFLELEQVLSNQKLK